MKKISESINEGILYSKDECGGCASPKVAIVCSCECMKDYAEKIVAALSEGGVSASISDADTKCEKVIILGNAQGNMASERANGILCGMKRKSEFTEGSYVIYKEGSVIAIAADKNEYTSYKPMGVAVDTFIEKCASGCVFKAADGVLASETLDLVAGQRKIDNTEDEARWANVREVIGNDDIYLAFKNMMESIFAKEMIPLIASFYDPATGMCYASLSGKNAEGIYPIPEGTSQVFGYMNSTGMLRKLGGKYVIPELSKYRAIYQMKSIQGEDGEFYVAQMKKNTIDSNRIGRDRGHCTNVLNMFGGKHTYKLADYEYDGVTADEYWADLVAKGKVTEEEKPIVYWAEDPAERKATNTVKKDDAKPSGAGTEQFHSHVGFVKWLLAKDPYNSPYGAMSNTASAAGIIKEWNGRIGEYDGEDTVITYENKTFELKHGDTLYSIIIRWADSHINAAGLFGKITNKKDENGNPVYDGFYEGWGYQNSNGFLKGIGRYSESGTKFPKPCEAIVSLLKGINSDEVVTGNILVIFNVWAALNGLRNNISKFYDGEERDELLAMINEGLTRKVPDEKTGKMKAYAAVALDKCTAKLLTFKKRDGGFAHNVYSGTPCWQGGMKVGIAADNLSDIDAINCSTALLTASLCDFFGLNRTRDIPMYTEADLLVFLDVMSRQEYVIKRTPMELEADSK